MSETSLEAADLPAPPRRRFPFSWITLLLLGLVLYELTSQPGIGCAAVCIKFGWEDFQTAWWLRRSDPCSRRGHPCFWLYGALGLWKAAFVAFLMSVALAIVLPSPAQNFPQKPAPVPATFFMCLGTFWTTLAGLLLSGLATIWAIWLGWRFRIKLWVNGAVQRSRRQNVWPPVGELAGRFNYLGLLIVNALIFFVFLLIGLIAGSAAYFKDNLGPGKDVLLVPVVLGLIIGFAALILYLRDSVNPLIRAASPDECWPSDERL